MITDCFFRSVSHLADLSELLGLRDYMGVMMVITFAEAVVPMSDEQVWVTEECFDDVEVMVYQPAQKQHTQQERRRGIIYIHGGGWCLGSSRMSPYDLLARQMVIKLNAVVLSVEYRLAPAHHFPVPFEDVYRGVKHFLRRSVLALYQVDPARIAISGDSAGGNLAAAVAQQLQQDPEQQVELRAQVLLYPAMQVLDLNTPSYQQNQHMPILPRRLMVRFWSEYFTRDKSLFHAMLANSHNGPEAVSLMKFVNWGAFLPERFRGGYNYTAPPMTLSPMSAEAGQPTEKVMLLRMDGPRHSLSDPRASPLLVPDTTLKGLPPTYVLTCEYDVLRDDGVMYATRLRRAGVKVTHEHYAAGFHGALMFTTWPADFAIAHRMTDDLLSWLQHNL